MADIPTIHSTFEYAKGQKVSMKYGTNLTSSDEDLDTLAKSLASGSDTTAYKNSDEQEVIKVSRKTGKVFLRGGLSPIDLEDLAIRISFHLFKERTFDDGK
ncbi:MAG: hypothetical protein ABIJ20_00970 [Nanoarchaeota archaeon]|nr:hypothetical protein [Nanoarchaeota archaeon]MBU1444727.1 hypothetical protein [Nanoarchaeota archaeon]MBU2406864.1 hypothetical protein [Nanoarchaeota archaeon]MBU2420777.1 hypothetical protein [Nanoarchaeota archaeon]MBU2475375.1 hypothetical protein [Nanoarchaeota archaeon]